MEFKDRLKELRSEKNISAPTLAEQLGKAESTIRMWEIGRAKPDVDTLIRLARYFNCTTDFLLGLDEFKNKEVEIDFVNLVNDMGGMVKKLTNAERKTFFDIIERILKCCTMLDECSHMVKLYPRLLLDYLHSCIYWTTGVCNQIALTYLAVDDDSATYDGDLVNESKIMFMSVRDNIRRRLEDFYKFLYEVMLEGLDKLTSDTSKNVSPEEFLKRLSEGLKNKKNGQHAKQITFDELFSLDGDI